MEWVEEMAVGKGLMLVGVLAQEWDLKMAVMLAQEGGLK